MRIDVDQEGRVILVWTTDYLPHHLADERAASYDDLFAELVAATNAHGARFRS